MGGPKGPRLRPEGPNIEARRAEAEVKVLTYFVLCVSILGRQLPLCLRTNDAPSGFCTYLVRVLQEVLQQYVVLQPPDVSIICRQSETGASSRDE